MRLRTRLVVDQVAINGKTAYHGVIQQSKFPLCWRNARDFGFAARLQDMLLAVDRLFAEVAARKAGSQRPPRQQRRQAARKWAKGRF